MDDVAAGPVQTSTVRSQPCPYPGLRPFEESESRLFFGRESETAEIIARLEAVQLVVVHGASGCGKSSVVRAGVIPYFRRDALANGRSAKVVVIRPSDPGGPLRSLEQKLEAVLPIRRLDGRDGDGYLDWSEMLVSSPDLPADIAASVAAHDATLCLVIDQFEEIFQLAKTDRQAEAARLIQVLTLLDTPAEPGCGLGNRPLSVIVTMRSDYLGQCSFWDGLAETVNRAQYLLPKISTVGLLRAIHKPAVGVGSTVQEEIADRLLPTIASEIDGLPIVQHALMRAWNAAMTRCGVKDAPPDELTTDDLEAIGGPFEALAIHAGAVLGAATAEDDQAAEAAEWIFRSLSEVDADGKIIRRACKFGDLVKVTAAPEATVRRIIDEFRKPENTLLAPSAENSLADDTPVDVGHEALLRRWPWISSLSYEKGSPRGLAYRELQDGMIWRSLVVQGEELAEGRGGVLGPASTEQRLRWYANIEKRPYWARRHRMRTGARSDREREWQDVAELMRRSRENLLVENQKLIREQEMVAKLKRNRRMILWLSFSLWVAVGLIAVAVSLAAYSVFEKNKAALQEKQIALQKSQALQETQFANRLILANELARRQCFGGAADQSAYQACLQKTVKANLASQSSLPETPDPNSVPFAPYGGVALTAKAQPPKPEKQP